MCRRNGEQTPGSGEDDRYRCSECYRTGDEEIQTVRRAPWAKSYLTMNMSLSRILEKEMSKLKDHALRPLVIPTLDHEEDKKIIRDIFQCVNDATMAFQVHTLILI
jgi:protein-arginine kinase activator protein McsA